MKNISSLIRGFLASGTYSGFMLIEIYANTVLRYTTLPYNVTVNGNVFLTDHNLVSADPPKIANSTDRAAYKLVFADPEYTYASQGDSLVNAKVVIKAGFLNTSGAPVVVNSVTYPVDAPILDLSSTFSVYVGRVDKTSYAVSDDDGVLFVLECGSPMINMDTVNAFYTTKDALKQRIGVNGAGNNDTAFDYVTVSGIRRSVQWGKV